ncbi:protein KASH5 [Nyctibius grandis]|uniref:protein KASH5 n=1 Tax=Nyctibius grandis TaxID=48427 RepID=UPI0035BC470D
MAAEGPSAPSPRTSVPPTEAALPAAEAETPQDLLQTAQGSSARHESDSRCSEEIILNCTFAACDPEQTGTVPARRVVEYLQAMTGQSGEEGQLQALRRMLDPEAVGAALDLPTFHAVMREWIASCQQEGGSRLAEEQDVAASNLSLVLAGEGCMAPAAAQLRDDGGNTNITSLTEAAGLRSRAEQLAAQNTKLQRDAELTEELNAHLAEEMAQLKAQLRCTQQALEQARAAAEELEDLKAVAKGLEEENGEFRRRARELEKERRCLLSRADSIQEENQQLLAESQGLRERIKALTAEAADREAQLCRCTALLSSRDTALAQARRQVEELTLALEEHDGAARELRQEATRLRRQLGQMQEAKAMQPWCPLGDADVVAQPLGAEIEATCWESGDMEKEEEDTGTVAPARRAPLALLALALALLALLCLLPHGPLGLPHGRATWPQMYYQRPPPL